MTFVSETAQVPTAPFALGRTRVEDVKLTHQHDVDASVDHMWRAFTDLKRVGRCFPGAHVSEVTGDDFVGALKVKLGPFVLTYDGVGSMTKQDESARVAQVKATGKERHGFGKADITIDVRLSEISARRSSVHITTTLDVKGAPTNLGGGIGQRASDPLIEHFVMCLSGPASASTGGPDDEPLDIGRAVLPGLVASYGRSMRRLGRKKR